MKTWFITAMLIGLMTFSGCGEQEKAIEPITASQLEGQWHLTEPVSNFKTDLNLLAQPPGPTVLTTALPLRGTGRAAVNNYSTVLWLSQSDNLQITVNSIASTKIAGSAKAMQFERTYYAYLKAANRYELTDRNRLKLYYDGGVLVYEK